MLIISDKLKILGKMNWKWAWKYFRKKFLINLSYRASLFRGQKFWPVDIDGTTVKFSFSHPYHHHFAKHLSENKHERNLLSLWKKQSESAKVILDIGAYNGVYGLIAAKANPRARVFIFEPDRTNAEHIKKNIALNNLSNAEIVQAAVTNHAGTIRFSAHDGATAGHISDNGDSVASVVIQDWAGSRSLMPELIKFDISGPESEILLSSKELLARADTMGILLESYPSEAESKIWPMLVELGYQTLYLYPRSDGQSTYYWLSKNL